MTELSNIAQSWNCRPAAGCHNGAANGSPRNAGRKADLTRWPYRPQARAACASSCPAPGPRSSRRSAGATCRPFTQGPAPMLPAGTCAVCGQSGEPNDPRPTGVTLPWPVTTLALVPLSGRRPSARMQGTGQTLRLVCPPSPADTPPKPPATSNVSRAGTGR